MAKYLGTGLSPMLSVRRGAQAVEFYKAAFDATVLFRFDADNGTVIANLAIGPANMWISDEEPKFDNFSPESLKGTTVRLILTVEDPDAAYDQAVAAGAIQVCPVRDEHAWRIGKLADPFGHVWEIGKPLK
jgi:PhnB protein